MPGSRVWQPEYSKAARGIHCPFAKRDVCAAKSFEARLCIFFVVTMPFPFEAYGTPNVVYAMVSAPFALGINDLCSSRSASKRPLLPVSGRQTLRVCSQMVPITFRHPCRAACRLAKHCVCAAGTFPEVGAGDRSSIRTRPKPPNAMYAMVFALPPPLC